VGNELLMTATNSTVILPTRRVVARFEREALQTNMRSSAIFSECRQYRYLLTRTWNSESATIVFIGLNPSTADETADDPTVRRCVGFARKWGYGGLVLINLFAFRSTDPKRLNDVADPVGPQNDTTIRRCCDRSSCVVAAWGAQGTLMERDRRVLELLSEPLCLGVTKSGSPRHPLYLAASTRLRRFPGVACGAIDRAASDGTARVNPRQLRRTG
jgi:hypothetical protein